MSRFGLVWAGLQVRMAEGDFRVAWLLVRLVLFVGA